MYLNFDDLKGKVAVLTGGCGVLGNTFSVALLKAGCKLALVDYKEERCNQYAKQLREQTKGEVLCAISDAMDKEGMILAKKKINEHWGKADILVNAVGGNSPKATTAIEKLLPDNIGDLSKSVFGLDIAGFRSVFDLNFLGTLIPTMVFAEDMLNRGGSIINISSMNSYRPLTKIAAYSAGKAAINNFTQWLAVHFSEVNIRVNAIAPGFFLTKQNEFLLIDKETKELTARGNKIINGTPMKRFGEPDELAGTLLYLASNLSKFVTGVIIPVDGGFSAYSGV